MSLEEIPQHKSDLLTSEYVEDAATSLRAIDAARVSAAELVLHPFAPQTPVRVLSALSELEAARPAAERIRDLHHEQRRFA